MIKYLAIVVISLLSVGCTENLTVLAGDEVMLLFELKNGSGARIDNSIQPQGQLPLRIIAGKDYLIKGMDKLIIGMKEGETKIQKIMPEEAYGKSGVFYLDENGKDKYVISPDDTLTVKIEVLKIKRM